MNKPLIIIGICLLAILVAVGLFTDAQGQLFGLYKNSPIPAAYTIPILICVIVLIIIGTFTGKKEKHLLK